MSTTKSSKTRFRKKISLLVLYFIFVVTTSCSGGTSSNTRESKTRITTGRSITNITTENNSVKVRGIDASGQLFECSGNDPDIRIDKIRDISGKSDDEIYDCRDGELVINR